VPAGAGRGLLPPFRGLAVGTEEPAWIMGGTPALKAVIALNVIVYIVTSYSTMFTQTTVEWISRLGFVPAQFLVEPRSFYRVFTAMFTHADIFHIFFNMYFLYLFGRAVERTLGSARFLALYLASGVAAAMFHTVFTYLQSPTALAIPSVGASGAISGVLGAYMLLYPGTRLAACFFLLFVPVCFEMLAAYYLLFWFAVQVLEGYFALNSQVAFFAHAGGFITGIALLPLVVDRVRLRYLQYLRAPVLFGGILRFIPWRHRGLSATAKSLFAALSLTLLAGAAFSYVIVSTKPALLAGYTAEWTAGNAAGADRFYVIKAPGIRAFPVVEAAASLPGRILVATLDALGVLEEPAGRVQLSKPIRIVVPLTFYRSLEVTVVPLSIEVSYTPAGLLEEAKVVELVRPTFFFRSFQLEGHVVLFGETDTREALQLLALANIALTLAALYVVLYRDEEYVIAPEF